MRVKQSIHDAFDTVSCDEVLKGRTCEYVIKHMHRSRKPAPRRMKWAVSLACLLLFATSGLGGYSLYYTEAAVISIDVNPSIELDINRWGKVVDRPPTVKKAKLSCSPFRLNIWNMRRHWRSCWPAMPCSSI